MGIVHECGVLCVSGGVVCEWGCCVRVGCCVGGVVCEVLCVWGGVCKWGCKCSLQKVQCVAAQEQIAGDKECSVDGILSTPSILACKAW